MAKLHLVFESKELKEFTITQSGVATIGRLPDNLIHIDNLAVSGHHARIFYDGDHYVVEDFGSTNGTFVNKQRITGKMDLNDGDEVTVGKHTVRFKDEWHEDEEAAPKTAQITGPSVPKLEATVMFDAKKAREMMSAAVAAKAGGAAPPPSAPGATAPAGAGAAGAAPSRPTAAPAPPPPPAAAERIGVLTVLAGKSDQQQYRLTSKLTVIGKSPNASIRLKGWFAPQVGATITKRDQRYIISPGEKKVMVDGQQISGQKELSEGSTVDVAGLKMSFDFE